MLLENNYNLSQQAELGNNLIEESVQYIILIRMSKNLYNITFYLR